MKRTLAIVAGIVLASTWAYAQRRGGRAVSPASAQYPPVPSSETEKRILGVIDAVTRAGDLFQNVPVADGRMLRLLTEVANAKHVVEIGTSTGLSGLWFCMALDKTGGTLTTFEYDPGRAATAKKNFKQAGVEHLVTIVQGDAHQTFPRLKKPIDVLFLDADKDGCRLPPESSAVRTPWRPHPGAQHRHGPGLRKSRHRQRRPGNDLLHPGRRPRRKREKAVRLNSDSRLRYAPLHAPTMAAIKEV